MAKDKVRYRILYTHQEIQESGLYQRAAQGAQVFWATPRKNCRIPVVWVRRGPGSELAVGRDRVAAGFSANLEDHLADAPLVLLHCHGNAADIGIMMGPYFELAHVLGVDVVGVEYTGYGASGGEVHTSHMTGDVEAAYELLLSKGIPPSRIVVYGQSIGSAPAVHLASRRPLGGVVLHSPLASALRVIDPRPNGCCRPSTVICCFDVFRNDRRIQSVDCPVYIMHGERDEVVPFHNACMLYRKCKASSRWPGYFAPRAGHNDLVECNTRMYFERLSGFLCHVARRATGAGGLGAHFSGSPGAFPGVASGGACASNAGLPRSAEKPKQVEMAHVCASEPVREMAVVAGQPRAVDGQDPPEVAEAVPMDGSLGPGASFATKEPKVGPDGSFYERVRRGDAHGTASQGAVVIGRSRNGYPQ